jgi:hypothetical protein
MDEIQEDTFRTPHLFDEELEQTLDFIRFVLFLPPTFSDAIRLRFKSLRFLFNSAMPHEIALLPWPAVTQPPLAEMVRRNPPFHWFTPPELIADLKSFLFESAILHCAAGGGQVLHHEAR